MEFRTAKFTPKDDLYKGEVCRGVKVVVKDRDRARPFDIFIQSFVILRDLYPGKFVPHWDEIKRVTGSGKFNEMIEAGHSAETILVTIRQSAQDFEKDRKDSLLYGVPKLKAGELPADFR